MKKNNKALLDIPKFLLRIKPKIVLVKLKELGWHENDIDSFSLEQAESLIKENKGKESVYLKPRPISQRKEPERLDHREIKTKKRKRKKLVKLKGVLDELKNLGWSEDEIESLGLETSLLILRLQLKRKNPHE